MSKQKLDKVLEYLVNKETDKASELLKSYIIEQAADIHQKLVESEEQIDEMERDVEHDDMGDDLADGIAADKDEIKSEEMIEGEDEEGEGEEHAEDELAADEHEGAAHSEEHLDLEDLEAEMEELAADQAEVDAHSDKIEASLDDMSAKFDKLAAEFEKIKNTEEVEHDVDFDNNGEIGGPGEAQDAGEEHMGGEEHMDGAEHAEELPGEEHADMHAEGIEESAEILHNAKPGAMKDTAPGAGEKSPVPHPKDRLSRLGGKPVEQSGPTHKGFERQEPAKKPGMVTKHTNTVNKGSDALGKASAGDMKDKAPHAGASPAMPKGKK